jgi:uncharacterized membrane protein
MVGLKVNIPFGLLLIACGLFSLSLWGYVLSILYLAYFGSLNGLMLSTHADLIYPRNLL